MVRLSKQQRRRRQSPKKRHITKSVKTGSKKDDLPRGFKEHENAIEGQMADKFFIPKIR